MVLQRGRRTGVLRRSENSPRTICLLHPKKKRRRCDVPRNLVICCDGTNNSLSGPPTNICHLSRLAEISDPARQRVHYDAGVGVNASPSMRTRIGATLSKWSGSAFGTGLVENVSEAYT